MKGAVPYIIVSFIALIILSYFFNQFVEVKNGEIIAGFGTRVMFSLIDLAVFMGINLTFLKRNVKSIDDVSKVGLLNKAMAFFTLVAIFTPLFAPGLFAKIFRFIF
ncbi:hypothetical protein SAMN06265182_2122 [Persephonella hydrogeniphila]|uniref:Uncharacterized protein n=1 Tax=Persephonella hydrogeniphila TaxID=198703 RepID=A0A285NQK0_9AQUI|nr:hypothetical protein [Persephonella hydrogeniphila]SNZ11794.1 hypothetical protein SAMN06265182_2122 [Persephonella hydrogeniphila]